MTVLIVIHTYELVQGDNFQLNVVNNLDDTTLDLVTTVHWHGLFQNHTNEMDGVDSVTQCPIIPGNSL